MAAVIAFLFLSSYARKETVTSYLTPAAGTVHVFQPRLGAISAVQVTQGQTVTEEQLEHFHADWKSQSDVRPMKLLAEFELERFQSG